MKNGFFTLLLGIVIGAGGYYYMTQEEVSEKEIVYPSNFAQVNQVSGLYIFQNSRPATVSNYNTINTLEEEVLSSIIAKWDDSDKHWTKKLIESAINSMSAEKKLDIIIQTVSDNYPNADAIILDNGFKRCEILELNSL